MAKKRTADECNLMAGDFARIATTHGDLRVQQGRPGFVTPSSHVRKITRGKKLFGSVVGPKGNEIFYDVHCASPGKGGKTCESYELRRSGPGAKGLKAKTSVGNDHGLAQQMSRDAARVWGCPPPATAGFEGARPRRRRRRRR